MQTRNNTKSYGFGYSDSILEPESHLKYNTGVKIDFEQIFAGKSTFTLLSKKTNQRMTFKFIRKIPLNGTNLPKYWVYVKITDEVTFGSSFKYIGFIYGYKGIYSSKNPIMLWDVSPELFQHSTEDGKVKDVKYRELGFAYDKKLEVSDSEISFITTPESIKTGIGPKCSKEVQKRTEKAKSKPVKLESGHVSMPHHS
jgi:hypothetical protein